MYNNARIGIFLLAGTKIQKNPSIELALKLFTSLLHFPTINICDITLLIFAINYPMIIYCP